MARTYLTPDIRLSIWSKDLQNPTVSGIHDHPWSFVSQVVAGTLFNLRFDRVETGKLYVSHKIITGEGIGVEPAEFVYLSKRNIEVLTACREYMQVSDEIHSTGFEDLTITILDRVSYRTTRDQAHVFCVHGEEFVSAAPRVLSDGEVVKLAARALARWF